jgi:peptidoglycan-N-acetylglucosamine deacetylase
MPSVSWPAVVVGAAVVGGLLGVVQPPDTTGPREPQPTAAAAEPAAAPSPPATRRTRPSPSATPATAPERVRWPADVRTTLPATERPQVALTFDDGPDRTWTSRILDELARHDVTATFCLVGEQIPGNERLVARISAEGHVLCNHTDSHDYGLPARDRSVIDAEIATTTTLIRSAARGAPVSVFRAPGGRFTPVVLESAGAQGLSSWGWSVDPQDWRRSDADRIVADVLDGVEPGAVVLLHDGGGNRSATVAAVAELVPLLQSVGYEFVGLPGR